MSNSIKELKKRARELGVDTSSIVEKEDLVSAIDAAETSHKSKCHKSQPMTGMETAELEGLVANTKEETKSKRTKKALGHPIGWWKVDPRSLRGLAVVELGEVDSVCVSFSDIAVGAMGEMQDCKAPGIVGVKLDRLYVATDDGKDDVALPDDMLLFRGKQLAFSFKNTEENADGFTVAAVKSLMEREILQCVRGYDDIDDIVNNGIPLNGVIIDADRGGFYTPGVDFEGDE